jgi:rhodanese-related sulfurtransferase
MKFLAHLLLLPVLATAVAVNAADSPAPTDISKTDLHRLILERAQVLLLDVRTPQEYAGGRIPGSMNVPVKELAQHAEAIREKGADKVVVYCASGPRALAAQELLTKAGVPNVLHLQGDMMGWRAAGLPVDTN